MAGAWDKHKIAVRELVKRASTLPPPPVPDDSWSEKVNNLTRTVHAMNEHVDSRIEAEERAEATRREE